MKVGCGFGVLEWFGRIVREGLRGWDRVWEGRGGVKVGR